MEPQRGEGSAALSGAPVEPESNDVLLIRADASPVIGAGHVMRCLALADAWRDTGGHVVFATSMRSDAPALRAADRQGVRLADVSAPAGSDDDAERTAALGAGAGASVVVVDGYSFGPDYVSRLRAPNLTIVQMDDEAIAPRFTADVVINQNAWADEQTYAGRVDAGTTVLAGASFAMLRPEFISMQRETARRHGRGDTPNVLITLGQSDAGRTTSQHVLRALAGTDRASSLNVRLLGQGTEPNRGLFASCSVDRVSDDMPHELIRTDLAIIGCGSTCWEAAYLGTPAIGVILAANQHRIGHDLARRGVMELIDPVGDPAAATATVDRLIADPDRRAEMSRLGRALIDGRGAVRVVRFLRAARSRRPA
ncbi:MAG: UDP-2,4-diacetamido-2,4,6-trideoxy-beta-L-altropyranose hydrolase [Planctomycetota bacterium]